MDSTNPESKVNSLMAFLKGFASAFDLSGKTVTDDMTDFSDGFERDAHVLRGDWERVENDLRKAMGQVVYGK